VSARRKSDEIEWTTRGRVFVVVIVFAFLATVYFLVTSGLLFEFSRFVADLWTEHVLHQSPNP
jgi:hypothetical protein